MESKLTPNGKYGNELKILNLNPNSFPDFELVTKGGRKISCHKVVLANVSNVIGKFLEFKSDENKNKYDLLEYNYGVIQYFIAWIYNISHEKCPNIFVFEFLKLLDYLEIKHNRVAVLKDYFDSLHAHEIFSSIKEGQSVDDLWNYSMLDDTDEYTSLLIKVFSPWKKIKKFLDDEVINQIIAEKPEEQYYVSLCILYNVLANKNFLLERVKQSRKLKIVKCIVIFSIGKTYWPGENFHDKLDIQEISLFLENRLSGKEMSHVYGEKLSSFVDQLESIFKK